MLRIKKIKYNNDDTIIIYINKREKNNKAVQNKIEKYKCKYKKNVSIFVSGEHNFKPILKEIIENN